MPVETIIASVVASLGSKGIEEIFKKHDNLFTRIAETLTDVEKEIIKKAAINPVDRVEYISMQQDCSLRIGENLYSGKEMNNAFKSLLIEGYFNPVSKSEHCAFFFLSTAGRLVAKEL